MRVDRHSCVKIFFLLSMNLNLKSNQSYPPTTLSDKRMLQERKNFIKNNDQVCLLVDFIYVT